MESRLLILLFLCAIPDQGFSEQGNVCSVNNATTETRCPRTVLGAGGLNDAPYLERLATLEKGFSRGKLLRSRKKAARRRGAGRFENLNAQQEMMAHALIDSLNEAFKEGEGKDAGPGEMKEFRKAPAIPGGTEAIVDEGLERGFEREGPLRDPFPPMRMPRRAGIRDEDGFNLNFKRRTLENPGEETEIKEQFPFQRRKSFDNELDVGKSADKNHFGIEKDEGINDFEIDREEVQLPQAIGPPFSQRTRAAPFIRLPSFKVRRRKSPELPVHCIRSAASTIECSHGNFSYSLTLPNALITQESVENLVSALCSIIETEDSPGGLIALNVRESQGSKQKKQSYFDFEVNPDNDKYPL